MADLVQEFFKRDLSEAEQEALSKLLESSPEAASNYERLLEQNYLATGLPQPTLPKGLQSLPHPGAGGITSLGGSIKIFLVVLAAAGVALWRYWPQTKVEITTPLQQPVQQVLEERQTVHVKPAEKNPAPVQPALAPPNQEGQELSVVVDAPQRSLVTVRILDPAGKEVRALYTGFVEPGRWNFKWDGLLGNGEAAGAGDYRIDVQTGAAHQTKDIRIKLRQPAS
jgi:hypothetical protein